MPPSVTAVVGCLLPASPSCRPRPWKCPSGPIQLHLDLWQGSGSCLHATRCLGPSVFAGEAGGPAPGQSSASDPCLPASGPALWGFCLAEPRKTQSLPTSFLSRLSGHSTPTLGPSLAKSYPGCGRRGSGYTPLSIFGPHLRTAFGIPEGEKGRGTQETTFRWTLQGLPCRTCPLVPGSGPGSCLSGWTSRGCVCLSLQ